MNLLTHPKTGVSTSELRLFRLSESALQWIMVAAITGIMIVHFLSLTIYPTIFIDEGWFANASWTWLNTGVNFDSMHTGVLDQFGNEQISRFFLGELPQVVAFQFLGVGLFQARLVAWIFGIVLLFTTVQVGRRTYGLTTGLLAALILTLSLPFLQSTRWRQDIMLTTFIMLSLWLALIGLQENKLWAHFLAGLLLAIGLDIHQVASLFIPALAAVYLMYYGKNILFRRGTWLVGIGGALGLAIFLAIHILPSPETYSLLMSFNFSSGSEAELPITNPPSLVASALGELGRYSFRRNLFDLGLIVVGGLVLLLRRLEADRLLLAFTVVAFADFVMFSGDKTFLYAIHLYPAFMLIVAAFLMAMIRNHRPLLVQAGSVLLVLFVVHGVYQLANRLYSQRTYDYNGVIAQMQEVIPDDARVMGMPMWWFGFADQDYRSSLSLTYFEFFNEYDVEEAMQTLQPDYLIVDNLQNLLLVDEGQELGPGLNAYKVPRDEFDSMLDAHGELIHEFADDWEGNFWIYKMNWAQS